MRAARPLGVPLLRIPFLLVVLAVAACGGSGTSPSPAASPSMATSPGTATSSPPAAVNLDRSASGTTVTLAPGQGLLIALDTNPSTGFSWEITAAPDPAVLTPLGEPAFVPAGGGQIGAGGQAVLTYTAVAPGETSLALVYRRSWESMADAADDFDLSVVVR
jgi:inhibitor of cysteine peptidase